MLADLLFFDGSGRWHNSDFAASLGIAGNDRYSFVRDTVAHIANDGSGHIAEVHARGCRVSMKADAALQ